MQTMHISHFVISLISLLFCRIALGESCEEGWLQVESSCFRVIKANTTFETAKFICTNVYKARLLTTPSDSQQDILVNVAKAIYGVNNGIWIDESQIGKASTACLSIGRNGIDKIAQDCSDRSSVVCQSRVPEKDDGQSKPAEGNMMSEEFESLKSKMVKMEKELSSLKETVDQMMSTFQVPECNSGVNPEAKSLVGTNDVTGQNTSTSAALSMKCAAPPVIVANPADRVLEVKEGHNTSLGCLAVGYPKPSIKWVLPNHVHTSFTGQIFTITQAKGHHTGEYVCVADNKVGEAVNVTFSVKVCHAPKLMVENSVIHTGTGQTVQLKCMIEAHPSAEVVWLKHKTGETLQQLEFKKLNETFVESILNLKIIDTASDLGIYTCSASNKEGSSRANITLVGTTPFNVRVQNATELDINKFQLTMMATSYSGIQEYKLKIKASDNPFSMETSVQPTGSQVPGKKTYVEYFEMPTSYRKKYKVKLYAKNEFGWSESPEYEFDSTYLCGDKVEASESWRLLISNEFYGKYTLPRDFNCESHIGSDSGLEIEFLEIESRTRHWNHERASVTIKSLSGIEEINYPTVVKLRGSSFTLTTYSERIVSKGFKARLRSWDVSQTTISPLFY